jgi:hypothetical protein
VRPLLLLCLYLSAIAYDSHDTDPPRHRLGVRWHHVASETFELTVVNISWQSCVRSRGRGCGPDLSVPGTLLTRAHPLHAGTPYQPIRMQLSRIPFQYINTISKVLITLGNASSPKLGRSNSKYIYTTESCININIRLKKILAGEPLSF